MSEEMNRHEAELNDAALEGVSGGYYQASESDKKRAAQICRECPTRKQPLPNVHCTGGEAELAELIHRIANINASGWARCPFYTHD